MSPLNLPSLERLFAAGRSTLARFPLTIAAALLCAITASWYAEPFTEPNQVRLLAVASLGLPLFTGITLVAERWKLVPLWHWAAHLTGIGALTWLWFVWPNWGEEMAAFRYIHLSATIHLAVSVGSFVGVRETVGFWEFNRRLFFRFILGIVYTGVLFAGLSIALLGIDNLFGIEIADIQYGRLWFWLGFVFQTWFFLSGVPDDYGELETSHYYPAGIRVFAQYVLLPLVSVYLVILTLYLARVVITTTWPSGWIGYLVSALAALGIFSLLMVHPQRGQSESRWIDIYARVFWFALLPSIVMLLLAISQRISQYGLTESRYLLLVLSLWLAATALFYVVTRSAKIKWIPLSLAVIGLVTWFGPWSASAASQGSQVGRLEGLLTEHEVLVDGRITPRGAEIPNADWRQVGDILHYLLLRHGTAEIDDWFEGGIGAADTIGGGTRPAQISEVRDRVRLILDHLALESAPGLTADRFGRSRIFASDDPSQGVSTAGFDDAIPDTNLFDGEYGLGDLTITFGVSADSTGITLDIPGADPVTLSLQPIVAAAEVSGLTFAPGSIGLPAESMIVESGVVGGETPFERIRIQVGAIRLRDRDGEQLLEDARGTILFERAEGVDDEDGDDQTDNDGDDTESAGTN